MRRFLKFVWDIGLSGIPPEALPYMVGSYTMDTTRLKQFLGKDYESVIKFTVTAALEDSLREELDRLTRSSSHCLIYFFPRYSPAIPNEYGVHETSRKPACFIRSEHLLRRRETRHRRRKIRIRPAHSGNQRANLRQHMAKIETVQLAEQSLRLAEIENPDFAVCPQHAMYLA